MCLLTFGGQDSARRADPSLPKVGIFGEFGSARERPGALIELPYLAIAPFLAFRHRRLDVQQPGLLSFFGFILDVSFRVFSLIFEASNPSKSCSRAGGSSNFTKNCSKSVFENMLLSNIDFY